MSVLYIFLFIPNHLKVVKSFSKILKLNQKLRTAQNGKVRIPWMLPNDRLIMDHPGKVNVLLFISFVKTKLPWITILYIYIYLFVIIYCFLFFVLPQTIFLSWNEITFEIQVPPKKRVKWIYMQLQHCFFFSVFSARYFCFA